MPTFSQSHRMAIADDTCRAHPMLFTSIRYTRHKVFRCGDFDKLTAGRSASAGSANRSLDMRLPALVLLNIHIEPFSDIAIGRCMKIRDIGSRYHQRGQTRQIYMISQTAPL